MFTKAYKFLIRLLYPIAIERYLQKRIKIGKEDANRFAERLGQSTLARPKGKLIWCHGASVGECLSMLPLINAILAQYKNASVLVTSGTVTSAELMKKRLPEGAFHQYVPVDNPKFVKSFIAHWQPDVALWFESEFWPALLSEIKEQKIPLILVNGRVSDKTFKRWKVFHPIIKELLSNFTLCLGQSEEDARRLKVLGAEKAVCLGNLKYAADNPPVDEEKKQAILAQIKDRKVWAVASTHHDEEVQIGKQILKIKQKFPDILTIIAPRHPQRGEDIVAQLNALGLTTALRSKKENIGQKTDVYVADTIGEIGLWYDIAPIVFVGGSLIAHGGQNFIEPSRFQDAVIVGPHMHNFTDAMNRAQKAHAVIQVKNADELGKIVLELLENDKKRQEQALAAYNWAKSEAQVLDGIVNQIKEYM